MTAMRGGASAFLGTLPVTRLAAQPTPMQAPAGIVYSSAPLSGFDHSNTEYVIKGPDLDFVVTEAVGYLLASELQIETPDFSLVHVHPQGTSLYFGSVKLTNAIRDVEPWLKRPSEAIRQTLAAVHAFDVWLGNNDRNLGGFLARSAPPGEFGARLVTIDFEKSWTLRGATPLVQVSTIEPKKFRPTGILHDIVRAISTPKPFLDRLKAISDHTIERAVQLVSNTVPGFTWADSSVQALIKRRDNIDDVLREVWK